MKTYNHITTLEIDETEVNVSIDFSSDGHTVEIEKMTDIETGDAIAPDLLNEINSTCLNNELLEFASYMQSKNF